MRFWTSSSIGGLPPTDRRYVHFLRTSSRCHRSSVCGLTRNDDQRCRGSILLTAARNRPVAARRRPGDLPLEHRKLVAKDDYLHAVVQTIRWADGEADQSARQ
jgi:hypothetical protein